MPWITSSFYKRSDLTITRLSILSKPPCASLSVAKLPHNPELESTEQEHRRHDQKKKQVESFPPSSFRVYFDGVC
jgi:hypothetical protein